MVVSNHYALCVGAIPGRSSLAYEVSTLDHARSTLS